MNKRSFVSGAVSGAIIAAILVFAVVVTLPPTYVPSLHDAVFGTLTIHEVMGQVTGCAWNHSIDAIEFTISAERPLSAPASGVVKLLYIPNGVIYGPGGVFTFAPGSTTTTVHALASNSGFDRGRPCIVEEWSPIFVE